MIIYLWTIIVLNLFGLLMAPALVGRTRTPLTVGELVVRSAVSLVVLVFATVALMRGWSA